MTVDLERFTETAREVVSLVADWRSEVKAVEGYRTPNAGATQNGLN